jgi:hypothetical protein
MSLDTATITVIGATTVLVIGAIVTGAVTIIRTLGEVRTKQTETADQLLAVAKDTEAIKGHVNSEKTAADGREMALRQENTLLRQQNTDQKATADLLAQAAAQRIRGDDTVAKGSNP